MLRTVILDFYHTEDILQAKWRLIDDITELHLEQTPRVSRRREGEKHIVRDLDDIFTLQSAPVKCTSAKRKIRLSARNAHGPVCHAA